MNKARLAAKLVEWVGHRNLLGLWRWSGALALNYHRIGDPGDSLFDPGLWSATDEDFDAQVRFLKAHFDLVGPGDLAELQRRGRGRHALITFDDGYRDNYEHAFPILRAHRVPALFFVAAGLIDRGTASWWDEIAWMVRTAPRRSLPASRWTSHPIALDDPGALGTLLGRYKSLPESETAAYLSSLAETSGSGRCPPEAAAGTWMTWEMVRAMRDGGMAIGGHTVTHPVLSRLDEEGQRREIAGCADRLRAELQLPMRWFSYPVGGRGSFNQETRRCLREAGVELAFSYYGGYRSYREWDPYDVRRIAIEREIDLSRFRAITTLPSLFGRERRNSST
jgi:peptidoglycan/xylan/chitin deacetylase (PgdA/CDA1 family)